MCIRDRSTWGQQIRKMQKFQIALVIFAVALLGQFNCNKYQNTNIFMQGYASQFGAPVQLSQLNSKWDIIDSVKEGSNWLQKGNVYFTLKKFYDFCRDSEPANNNPSILPLYKGIEQACSVYYMENVFFSKAYININEKNPKSLENQGKEIYDILTSATPDYAKAGTLFAQLTQKFLAEQVELEKVGVSELLYGLFSKYGQVSDNAKSLIQAKVQPRQMLKLLVGVIIYEEFSMSQEVQQQLLFIRDFFTSVKGYQLSLGVGQTNALADVDKLYSNFCLLYTSPSPRDS
eukprot:TRINITY_DN5915_c0_g1_i2.p1 TRINITY_DN5915_c0_g1~~TRINITY_DN5915_c0_g1_i2.p1  ORF type:complete len:289 (+),score=38.75 TRINITY_DN5915_c0_g1_i2:63-929(+)